MLNRAQAARMLNLSIIGVSVSKQDIFDLIFNVRKYPLAGLAVEASHIEYAHSLLSTTPTRTIGVANYPLGGSTISYTLEMTRWCFLHGADEMDICVPVSLIRSNELLTLQNYLKEAVQIADGRNLKGVIWSDSMTDQEIIDVCHIMVDCKVNFVKTNPGFKHVTSPHVIPLIKNALRGNMKVDVAGDIQNAEQMMNFVSLGADIVTTSSSDSVLKVLPEF